MSKRVTPAWRSASSTAFMSAGRDPLTPASPTPFAPSGLVAVGTGCSWIVSPSTRREREERDRAVGAFDAIGPVGELDVGGGGFEILRGERKALLYDLLRGELHHAPYAEQRARAAGGVADQAHGGIAVPQAEVLHRHAEDGGDDLRVARLVALPVRMRDRVHRDPAA